MLQRTFSLLKKQVPLDEPHFNANAPEFFPSHPPGLHRPVLQIAEEQFNAIFKYLLPDVVDINDSDYDDVIAGNPTSSPHQIFAADEMDDSDTKIFVPEVTKKKMKKKNNKTKKQRDNSETFGSFDEKGGGCFGRLQSSKLT